MLLPINRFGVGDGATEVVERKRESELRFQSLANRLVLPNTGEDQED